MSFIDGIFNGISGAVKGVLGIHDEPAQGHADQHDEAPARSRSLAKDSTTTYESSPSTTRSSAGDGDGNGFSLLGYLESNVATRGASRAAASGPAAPERGTYSMSEPPPVGEPSQRLDAAIARVGGGGGADSQAATTVSRTAARATVYDSASGSELGTVDTLGGDQGAAAVAARNVQRGLDYFHDTFGRDGVDGAGGGVSVLIGDRSTDERGVERFKGNGGYYAMPDGRGGTYEAIHFGTGTSYDAANGHVDQREMLYADDLTIHELVHGVIRKQTGHLGGDADEAGATNEAMADVLAAAATRDWRIGEGMYTDSSDYRMMRDIANPDDPTAIHGLWTSIDQVRAKQESGGDVEEHWASGVLSTAAYRMQQRLGGEAGWRTVEQVYYGAITQGRLGDMSFGAVAAALRSAATSEFGAGSQQAQVVDDELRRAGI